MQAVADALSLLGAFTFLIERYQAQLVPSLPAPGGAAGRIVAHGDAPTRARRHVFQGP
jgi:hypothetical protein